MMVSRLKFLAVSVFLVSLLSLSVPWVSASNGDTVSPELTEAEEALTLAYTAVSDAEEAGADVSDLLAKLNIGSEYLNEAHTSFLSGDSESADRLAGLCVEAVNNVKGEAVLLKDEAARSEMADFLARGFISAIGIVIVVVGGFALWGAFRRRYLKRVLGLKPEVNDGES